MITYNELKWKWLNKGWRNKELAQDLDKFKYKRVIKFWAPNQDPGLGYFHIRYIDQNGTKTERLHSFEFRSKPDYDAAKIIGMAVGFTGDRTLLKYLDT